MPGRRDANLRYDGYTSACQIGVDRRCLSDCLRYVRCIFVGHTKVVAEMVMEITVAEIGVHNLQDANKYPEYGIQPQ